MHHSDWRFTFGISIDELALRYDTCLRREKRGEREGRERGERGEIEKRERGELDVMYSGHN